MDHRPLTSHAVARLARVSPSTVITWVESGQLRAFRTPGGHRRIEPGELVRFLRSNGMPIPPELEPTLKLVVIDDSAPFRRSLEAALSMHAPNLEVTMASNATDGLVLVGAILPDAVLMDAYMPGIDGVTACRDLRQSPRTRNIKVIAISGDPSPELARDFIRAGAIDMLSKPFEVNDLLGLLGMQVNEPAAAMA